MSSIGIATLGMFDQGTGDGTINAAGGVIHVSEEKPKPKVQLIKITSKDEQSKKKIEVISITGR